jgi:polyferredoxin
VGITDQPGSFIATGQLKSMKCIGVGDCVTACPYQNVYFYDIRGWLRERLWGPRSPATQSVTLSVAPSRLSLNAKATEVQ